MPLLVADSIIETGDREKGPDPEGRQPAALFPLDVYRALMKRMSAQVLWPGSIPDMDEWES